MDVLHTFILFHLLTCLGLHTLGSEIINGKKAKEKSMLYMASVQDNMGNHICGGFLISEDFVLTAAHCDNLNPTNVVLGTHNLKKVDNDTMRYGVKTCKHPSYEKVNKGDDIMLLKLSKKVRQNKRVRPIQLAKNKVKERETCRVAGWGLTKTGGKVVEVLQEVDVPVVKLEDCQKQWNHIKFKLPAGVICAGGYGTDKGFCQGDSGGPLVCRGKATGVVSFNMRKNCDYPNVPNVYTNILKFIPWIKKILRQKNC